jgi:hypothetical protein
LNNIKNINSELYENIYKKEIKKSIFSEGKKTTKKEESDELEIEKDENEDEEEKEGSTSLPSKFKFGEISTSERMRSKNRVNNSEDKKKYILDFKKIENGTDKRTTLMIKNIPNKYTQKMLISTFDEKFKKTYDFIYLPIDFKVFLNLKIKNRCNVGYSFINFINIETIPDFYESFNEKKWEKFNSEKICEITYARIQGKQNLIEHFQNSSLMSEDISCRPVIFSNDGNSVGEEIEFPSPLNISKSKIKRTKKN